MIKTLLGAILFAAQAWGQAATPPIIIGSWLGLNDTDPSVSLQNSEAQDALNVESGLSGLSIQKRSGFSRLFSLTVATAPVNGSFSFIDANGSREDIVCQDHNCAKSVNGGSFSVFLSTAGGACTPTRWSFQQLNGTLYGANDCRDPIFQYNGTLFQPLSVSTWTPQGAVLAMTRDRLAVADVSSNPNAVYYSKSGTPSYFVTGINSADSYIDVSGSQGSRITALQYTLGRLFIFMTNSISNCILADQYSSRCFPVSSTIGTNDPLSIVEVPGGFYFRGNDQNYWAYDGTNLSLVSKKISNFVKTQNVGTAQSNTQTSQSDFNAGTQTPASSWNTSTVAGSIFPSSVTFVDSSTTAFAAGIVPVTLSTNTYYGLIVSSSAYPIPNGNFASGSLAGWTCATSASGGLIQNSCAYSASGGDHAQILVQSISGANAYQAYIKTELLDGTYSASSTQYNLGDTGLPTTLSFNLSSLGISTRALTIKYTVSVNDSDGNNGLTTIQSTTFSAISSMTVTFVPSLAGKVVSLGIYTNRTNKYFGVTQSSVAASFQSQIFNTGYSTAIGGPFTAVVSSPTGTSVTFQVRSSSSPNNDFWTAWTSISTGTRITQVKQYEQYQSSFTTSVGTAAPTLSLVQLQFATTGQFVTQCIQPGTNISAWGLMSCAQTTGGNGSEVFYATSAASCASLPTTAPLNSAGSTQSGWTAQTNNASLTISTNAALVLGWRSLLTSATDQAQIDACTVYWNNGVVAPPVWGTFDSVKNAIYWTSAINNNATNNRVLKYDLNLNQWYPFDLNANAIRSINNTTYFGDSTGGYWNIYGNVSSDNGSAINSYWKSKDFGNSTNPFLDNNYSKLSLVTKNQITGNMTVTYTTANNASGSYTVSLSTTSGIVYVHSNQNLPLMSPYQFMNVKFGNNSTTPWEIDGAMLEYESKGWKPQNP